ncbi:MAG: hypothetical protein Q7N50_06070 [Armatimonadota bacterium]|nr:hypothetical protein [Armatimonadota bacterium]
MDISEINMRLSSMAWTSINGKQSDDDVRIFPAARVQAEVIGVYQRFASEAQRFEVVSQDGRMVVRPWLPETNLLAQSSYGVTEETLLKVA